MNKNPQNQFSVGVAKDNIFEWDLCFEGPVGTLYEVCIFQDNSYNNKKGGFFNASLSFPEDYPNSPPVMKFRTEMWHPNIYNDGTVCISILHKPTDTLNDQESSDEKLFLKINVKIKFYFRWRPVLGVEQILISVISMLNDPNIYSPANVDAAV